MRSPLTLFLVALGSLAVVYQLFAHFPSISSNIGATLKHAIPSSQSNYCTKDVGEGTCCDLFLGAELCVEECRKKYVDRETLSLTKEFDECSDECLVVYKSSCVQDNGRKSVADVDDFAKEEAAGVDGPKVSR